MSVKSTSTTSSTSTLKGHIDDQLAGSVGTVYDEVVLDVRIDAAFDVSAFSELGSYWAGKGVQVRTTPYEFLPQYNRVALRARASVGFFGIV